MSNDKINIGEKMKSKLTAILLCFFLGGLGIHRFYLGYTITGVIQLLTFGGFLIWVIIDFIRLITGSLEDSEGNVLEQLPVINSHY